MTLPLTRFIFSLATTIAIGTVAGGCLGGAITERGNLTACIQTDPWRRAACSNSIPSRLAELQLSGSRRATVFLVEDRYAIWLERSGGAPELFWDQVDSSAWFVEGLSRSRIGYVSDVAMAIAQHSTAGSTTNPATTAASDDHLNFAGTLCGQNGREAVSVRGAVRPARKQHAATQP